MGCIIRHHMFIAFLHAPAEARLYGGTRVFYVYIRRTYQSDSCWKAKKERLVNSNMNYEMSLRTIQD